MRVIEPDMMSDSYYVSTFDRFHLYLSFISHHHLFDSNTCAISFPSFAIYITKNEPVSDPFLAFRLISPRPLRNNDRLHLQSCICTSRHLSSTRFSTFPSFRTSPLSIQHRTSCLTLRHPITLSRVLSCQCRACLQLRPDYLHPSSSPT